MYCHPVKIANKKLRQNVTKEERKIQQKTHKDKRKKVKENAEKKSKNFKKTINLYTDKINI